MRTRPRPNEKAHLDSLGRALKERRVALGLAQEELAELSGLHRTYIGSVERGERNVTILGLIRITAALQLPTNQVLLRAKL